MNNKYDQWASFPDKIIADLRKAAHHASANSRCAETVENFRSQLKVVIEMAQSPNYEIVDHVLGRLMDFPIATFKISGTNYLVQNSWAFAEIADRMIRGVNFETWKKFLHKNLPDLSKLGHIPRATTITAYIIRFFIHFKAEQLDDIFINHIKNYVKMMKIAIEKWHPSHEFRLAAYGLDLLINPWNYPDQFGIQPGPSGKCYCHGEHLDVLGRRFFAEDIHCLGVASLFRDKKEGPGNLTSPGQILLGIKHTVEKGLFEPEAYPKTLSFVDNPTKEMLEAIQDWLDVENPVWGKIIHRDNAMKHFFLAVSLCPALINRPMLKFVRQALEKKHVVGQDAWDYMRPLLLKLTRRDEIEKLLTIFLERVINNPDTTIPDEELAGFLQEVFNR